jgi:ribosomal protein S18 acetylase RimI-like enzyme
VNIVIRRGKLKDAPFVRKLAVESVVYGIPSTRKIPPNLVREFTKQSLANLEFDIYQPNFALIIAEDTDARKPVGYLMLDLNQVEGSTGEKQSIIHDLAVEKPYWGKFVVDRLMAEAENITRGHGLPYIVGEISADNKRPLIYSTKRLGYTVERHQIVKSLE